MKEKSTQKNRTFGSFGIALVLVFSFVFLLAITPAFASPAFQTVTGTATTAAGGATSAPTTAVGGATSAPTTAAGAASTAAPTTGAVATLAAPAAGAGTPTALVPVTGADLTQSDGTRGALMVAVGLIGLFLIAYGVFARLAKRTNR